MKKQDQHFSSRYLHMLLWFFIISVTVGGDSSQWQTGNPAKSLYKVDLKDAIFYFIYETSYLRMYLLHALSLQSCPNSLRPYGLQTIRLLCPWDSPGKNTGVGRHAFHQGIFPTQGLNPHLLHCRQILYPLSHLGSLCIIQ